MNGVLALNKTGGLALEPRCSIEPVEESEKTWLSRIRLFDLLRTQEPRTAEGSGEVMGKRHTSADTSIEEYDSYLAYSRISYRKEIADLFPKAALKLGQFEGLKKNWNGDQAPPPSSETLEHAYEILGSLWQVACTRNTLPPEPNVTCGAHGDITFSWVTGEKELELGFSIERGTPKYEYLICLVSGAATCEEGYFEGQLMDSPTFKALFSGR